MLQKTLDEFSPTDTCPDCGNEYKRISQHFAMTDCTGKNPSKTEIECGNCDKSFKVYDSRIESTDANVMFCSKQCRAEGERRGKEVPCEVCGEEIYRSPAHLDQKDHFFCSRNCFGEWYDGGEQTPTYDERECAVCNESIKRRAHHFTGQEAVCDMDCFSAWMSEQKRGAKNPAWKGGKKIISRVRATLGDRSWNRIAAEQREQAGHECEECDASPDDRRLSVHHIIPVASGGTHGDWNLMVLCNDCHLRIEDATRQFTDPHLFAPVAD